MSRSGGGGHGRFSSPKGNHERIYQNQGEDQQILGHGGNSEPPHGAVEFPHEVAISRGVGISQGEG
jgi:hypothetical protein